MDLAGWKSTGPYDLPPALPSDDANGNGAHPRAIQQQAIRVLVARGFVYVGEDSVGLPCYRSRSGAILIGVGSCRCLAYAAVHGRLQVVAAARTLSLLCRIGTDAPADNYRPVSPARPFVLAVHSPHPEPVLVI